ncbi:MAG: NYN domain-containing protein [Deferribacteraceae bacterium]|jgi:uncharacterized LabA/DUF88 family protein|nr:NYN domain-containing protein [Deferribacteraceae bacterium]
MSDFASSRLVVLIDADNASASIVDCLLQEVAKYGTATVKRIYGDWTSPHLKGWKDVLLTHAIQPIQQFSYTTGKNSTDSAMIIDAMDLLYARTFDGFCIVSSDSDFTRLASRIREAGHTVYGFGEKKTPQPFISACDKFIYTEILKQHTDDIEDDNKPVKRMTTKELKGDTKLLNMLRTALNATMDEEGWAYLGSVGQHIANHSPEFDPRNYGYSKLTDIIRQIQLFQIDERSDEKAPHVKQIYIKDKRSNKASGV